MKIYLFMVSYILEFVKTFLGKNGNVYYRIGKIKGLAVKQIVG